MNHENSKNKNSPSDSLMFQDLQIENFKQQYIFEPFEYPEQLQQTLSCPIMLKKEEENNGSQCKENTIQTESSFVERFDSEGTTTKTIVTSKEFNHSNGVIRNGGEGQCQSKSVGKRFKMSTKSDANGIFGTNNNDGMKSAFERGKGKASTFNSPEAMKNSKNSLNNNKELQQKNKIPNSTPFGVFGGKMSQIKTNTCMESDFVLTKSDEQKQKVGMGLMKLMTNKTEQSTNSVTQSIFYGMGSMENTQSQGGGSPLQQLSANVSLSSGKGKNYSCFGSSQQLLTNTNVFYNFCMMLFPENVKSVPLDIYIVDTLFYCSNESKDILYVFKDSKKGSLIKMKNKNKTAYELFMKRRANYETGEQREQKLRNKFMRKKDKQGGSFKSCMSNSGVKGVIFNRNSSGEVKFGKKFTTLEALPTQKGNFIAPSSGILNHQNKQEEQLSLKDEYQISHTSSKLLESDCGGEEQKECVVKFADEEQFLEDGEYESSPLMECSDSCQYEEPQECSNFITEGDFNQHTNKKKANQSNLNLNLNFSNNKPSHQQLKKQPFPLLTPDNSVRSTFQNQQMNYIALLRYKDNNFIRLRENEFKAIFLNPLYANQRFKNNNNTQYIQSIPYQQPHKDIREWSIHFHSGVFEGNPLFEYAKKSLYKENQFLMTDGGNGNGSLGEDIGGGFFNQERNKNMRLKELLKAYNVEIYLYYLIFEMYAYISMHHGKNLQSGVFKFIEFEKQSYALCEVQNIFMKTVKKEGYFRKAKVFDPEFLQQPALQEINSTSTSGTSTPNGMVKKINQEILKIFLQKAKSSKLEDEINEFFEKENRKVETEMNIYIKETVEAIKNVKDQHLSKNIFNILNPDSEVGLHELLNSEKKTKQFLLKKDYGNIYTRKSISNFSVIRCRGSTPASRKNGQDANLSNSMCKEAQGRGLAQNSTLKEKIFSCKDQNSHLSKQELRELKRQKLKETKALNYKYSMFNLEKFSMRDKKNSVNRGKLM